jgi:hypothetical protein
MDGLAFLPSSQNLTELTLAGVTWRFSTGWPVLETRLGSPDDHHGARSHALLITHLTINVSQAGLLDEL